MRILAITDSHPPYHSGGYELRCKAILDQLRVRGHEILIITTQHASTDMDPIAETNVTRILHSIHSGKNFANRIVAEYIDVTNLDRILRLFEPDIIYLGHVINLTKAMFPYLAETNTPIVIDDGGKTVFRSYYYHGVWYAFIERKSNAIIKNLTRILIRELVVVLSRNRLKRRWHWPGNVYAYFNTTEALQEVQSSGIPLRNTQVFHSAIDLDAFTYSKSRAQPMLEILVPGRIEPQKGTRDAVMLLDSIRRRNIAAQLTILGKPFDTAYYREVRELIEILQLRPWVTILPQVTYYEMRDYYHRSQVCFFPSYQKMGLSRIPLEAMACGCLVVTYGNEGSNNFVHHGDTGGKVQQGDFVSAANFIIDTIMTPAALNRITRNARQMVEQNHSMGAYLDAIESFLYSVEYTSKRN